MQTFKAKIQIRLKSGILDPQGQTIAHALQSLGFSEVQAVRTGKLMELQLQAENRKAAEDVVKRACEKLLANPVTEEYHFEVAEAEEDVTV